MLSSGKQATLGVRRFVQVVNLGHSRVQYGHRESQARKVREHTSFSGKSGRQAGRRADLWHPAHCRKHNYLLNLHSPVSQGSAVSPTL